MTINKKKNNKTNISFNEDEKSNKLEIIQEVSESKLFFIFINVLTIGIWSFSSYAYKNFLLNKKLKKETSDSEKTNTFNFLLNEKLKKDKSVRDAFWKSFIFYIWYLLLLIPTFLISICVKIKDILWNNQHLDLNPDINKIFFDKNPTSNTNKKEEIKIPAKNIENQNYELNKFYIDTNIEKYIKTDFKDCENKRKNDFFILFLFCFSYLILSIITLGAFAIYALRQKKNKPKEFNILDCLLNNHVINKESFNKRQKSLIAKNVEKIDFASVLLSKNNEKFASEHKSLFRTEIFKNDLYRFISILFISIITLGLFPIYILYSWAFFNEKNDWKKIAKLQNKKINKKWKHKLISWRYDFNLAKLISSEKINYFYSTINLSPGPKDFFVLFIRTITSPMFKWIFTLLITVTIYSLLSIWYIWFGCSTDSPIFIPLIVSTVLFFIAISYHIFLLF